MTSGCGCTKARGMQCCEQFSPEYVTSARETYAELTRSELDMAILGQLAAATNTSSLSTGMLSTGRTHHAETERERWYISYFHQGKPVCQKMFRFLHGIGEKTLEKSCCKLQSQQEKATHSWQCQEAPPQHHFIYFLAILRTLFSTTRSCMPFFSQEDFQAIVVQTSNSFHQAIRNEPSGEVTSQQLKQMPPYVL